MEIYPTQAQVVLTEGSLFYRNKESVSQWKKKRKYNEEN